MSISGLKMTQMAQKTKFLTYLMIFFCKKYLEKHLMGVGIFL